MPGLISLTGINLPLESEASAAIARTATKHSAAKSRLIEFTTQSLLIRTNRMRPLLFIERRYKPRVAFWEAQFDDSCGFFRVSRLHSCRITITTTPRRL